MKLNKSLAVSCCAAVFFAGGIMSKADEVKNLCIVKDYCVGVYADTDDQAERVTQVLCGEVLGIIDDYSSSKLTKVFVPLQYREKYGYPGWIYKKHIKKFRCKKPLKVAISEAPAIRRWKLEEFPAGWASEEYSKRVLVSVPSALVYAEPNTKSKIVKELPAASVALCSVSGSSKDFWQIELPGKKGRYFILKSQTSESTLEPSAQAAVKSALKFKGTPYLWGGMSSYGIDCSGLIYIVCRMHGLIVPRDADQQFEVGIPVKKENLKLGDIVFFGSSKGTVTHVGFSLGGSKFFDASGRYGVNFSSLEDPRYKNCCLGGRRYF